MITDTTWSALFILFPYTMDGLHSERFISEYEKLHTFKSSNNNVKKKTIGFVFCMGAQNRGVHLTYERMISNLTHTLTREQGFDG